MDNKPGKFYIDWWNVKKSTIYGIAAVLIMLILLGAGGWWIWANRDSIGTTDKTEIPKDAARVVSFEGDVRIIRAATRETILVTKETFVSAGDTIQTQADGRARIQMIDGSTLYVRPNSTVIIRDSSSIFGGTDVRVALDDGQINVRTEDQPENAQNIVEVQETENELMAQTDASFNINPNTKVGEIRISRGGVESNADGRTTIIKEGEFASVNNGKLASKEKLITPPKPVSPASSKQIVVFGEVGEVNFTWQKNESVSIENYQLQIAKSPFFVSNSIVLERTSLKSSSFSDRNISPGTYYWRVRATADSGQTSDWSEPVRFSVIRGTGGTRITAGDWEVERIGGRIYLVSGKTKPGAIVRANGRETFAQGDGSFRLQLAGSGNVRFEISDEQGNRSSFLVSLSSGKVLR